MTYNVFGGTLNLAQQSIPPNPWPPNSSDLKAKSSRLHGVGSDGATCLPEQNEY